MKKFLTLDLNKIRPKNFNFNQEIFFKNTIKFVEKNHGFKTIKNCPICLSSKSNIYITKHYMKIVQCSKCNLTYSEKQPKNFNDVYSSDDYLQDTISLSDKIRKYRIIRFARERIKILKKYKKKGSLLDIGCGTGWFLQEAKKHYDTFGVEYSDTLRKWLKKKINILSFKNISDVKNKFDIITVFDVIEHVPNPLVFLKSLKKKMKKNGIILIFTPNIDSLGFTYLKEKNNLLCPPHHLYYFNKKSFEFLCRKLNFDIIETQYKGLDIGDMYGLMNRNKDFKTANFLKKNFEYLQEFVDKTKFSNHVRFVIKCK